jgi:hypothetical protein
MSRLITIVELRGLEPLTFSLRRHSVDLIMRPHTVIDVQIAAGKAPSCKPGAHTGHMAKAQRLVADWPRWGCHLEVTPHNRMAPIARVGAHHGPRREHDGSRTSAAAWKRLKTLGFRDDYWSTN